MSIEITKEFTFEASHIIPGYPGDSGNLHGHSYTLIVRIVGDLDHDMDIDFDDISKIVNKRIISNIDHSFIGATATNSIDIDLIDLLEKNGLKLYLIPYEQTTPKNIAMYIQGVLLKSIFDRFPEQRLRIQVELRETADTSIGTRFVRVRAR